MELYTLKNKIPVRAPSEPIWRQWKQENMAACEVGRTYIQGTMIVTKFRGYDQTGAGYLFVTVIKDDNGRYEEYGAKTWSDAENQYCQQCKMVEDELLVKARKEAHQRRINDEQRTEH